MVQYLPAAEDINIDEDFSCDVLPETEHSIILTKMLPFKWLSIKFVC
jgi:hypothetical protein